ncbi:MAG TPA: YfaZ family outer membrane protein [Gammaproteobacteria bacterium]|nr:YfaZ family outer membrane protein [Gammaproteobacteria bacterium]
MQTRYWLLLLLLPYGISTQAVADEAEFYLSNESLQGRYVTGADVIGLSAANLGAEVFINDEDDVSAAVDLSFVGQPAGIAPLTFSVGPKIYAATLDIFDDNFAAGAVGGSAAYQLPLRYPVQLMGQFFYAPEIITFGDADDIYDLILRIQTPLTDRVTGFIGYRRYVADIEDVDDDHELDNNFHIGASLQF